MGVGLVLVSMGKIVSEMFVMLDIEAFRLDLPGRWAMCVMESLGVRGSTVRLEATSENLRVGVSNV